MLLMAHISEDVVKLRIIENQVSNKDDLVSELNGYNEIAIVILPPARKGEFRAPLVAINDIFREVARNLGNKSTLVTIGEDVDLVHVQTSLGSQMRYQHWISIKRKTVRFEKNKQHLPQQHFSALINTKYRSNLAHTKTRILYSYCPACDRTSKDYGGKKHTYNASGTLISDVWRDISCDPEGDLSQVIDRFADFLGVDQYSEISVFDCRRMDLSRGGPYQGNRDVQSGINSVESNVLICGDCIEELKKIPDNSIDFIFVDPPYNLSKKYLGCDDDLEIAAYFKWCDEWLGELARVLKPGRTLAIINIPLWSVRHFQYLETVLQFQSWIVWEALSLPVRMIMPSNYTILCFSKGMPRALPGLVNEPTALENKVAGGYYDPLRPLGENYCLRLDCVNDRKRLGMNDRGPLTDLWWDIHRLKHNVYRVDHPCQLPPHLMYRLMYIFTEPGEIVLDCFNGSGTTSITAQQLGRKYIGIEKSAVYNELIKKRHSELLNGLDPFRKEERVLMSKNSRVPRMPKQKYAVPKKTLQLEVKRIASIVGHVPNRDEVVAHSVYPIKYYDDYFVSWGEVCAAARTTGMSEMKNEALRKNQVVIRRRLTS
jgi:site-specific DNA-methyltransferase (adenine-specific)